MSASPERLDPHLVALCKLLESQTLKSVLCRQLPMTLKSLVADNEVRESKDSRRELRGIQGDTCEVSYFLTLAAITQSC